MIALARHSEVQLSGKRGVPQHRKKDTLVDSICGCCKRSVINTKKGGSFLYERLPCQCQDLAYCLHCGKCSEHCRCPASWLQKRGD